MATGWRRRYASSETVTDTAAAALLEHRVTSPLRASAAAWSAGLAPSAVVVRLTAELLAATDDADLLLPLASLPLEPEKEELQSILLATFAAADDSAALETPAADLLALRWACGETIDGRMAPQQLCALAHGISEWEGPAAFSVFEVLDVEYGDADGAGELPLPELDAEVHGRALEFLDRSRGLVD